MNRVLPILAVLSVASVAFADDSPSNSPYIDSIRKNMKDAAPSTGGSESYTQTLQNKLKEKDKASGPPEGSYTEELKKELGPSKSDSSSFTEQQRAILEPKKDGGAIDAVKEGHSDLHARIEGDIHNAANFRFGGALNRSIAAASIAQGASFSQVYPNGEFLPDLNLTYEYQPWHSEWWGSLGIMVGAGLGIYKGTGVFAFNLQKPAGGFFGTTSQVSAQFFDVPLVAGLSYRLNVFRLFRPFVSVGPTFIALYEQRSDGGDAHTADARGIFASAGVSILMDWVSKSASWDLYSEHGVKHYYLTLEVDQIAATGPVSITTSGAFAGLTFEF